MIISRWSADGDDDDGDVDDDDVDDDGDDDNRKSIFVAVVRKQSSVSLLPNLLGAVVTSRR